MDIVVGDLTKRGGKISSLVLEKKELITQTTRKKVHWKRIFRKIKCILSVYCFTLVWCKKALKSIKMYTYI